MLGKDWATYHSVAEFLFNKNTWMVPDFWDTLYNPILKSTDIFWVTPSKILALWAEGSFFFLSDESMKNKKYDWKMSIILQPCLYHWKAVPKKTQEIILNLR